MPFHEDTLHMGIAGEHITLQTSDLSLGRAWRRRYASFVVPPAGDATRVTVRRSTREHFLALREGALQVYWRLRDGRLEFESHFEQGYVSLETGDGELWLTLEGSVENFLRVLVACRCARGHGLLVHASAVAHDGRAFVFFGPSGSGKSTIARLPLAGRRVLGDDVVVVRKLADTYNVYPVPFALFDPGENRGYPLAGLFRLRKGPEHRLAALPAATGCAQLLASTPFIQDDPELRRAALETCQDLLQAVPAMELWFSPDPSVWSVLDGSSPGVPLARSAR